MSLLDILFSTVFPLISARSATSAVPFPSQIKICAAPNKDLPLISATLPSAAHNRNLSICSQ